LPHVEPRVARAILFFFLFGIVLRLARWLLNFPMWCDETMLAANLLDRGWRDLMQPLAYRQVCPIGFLVLQWLTTQILGFSEQGLRLAPLACSLASMPLFCSLARRVLGIGTRATLVAVATFATAEPLIRYAGEAKPYEADVLVSLVLLNLAVATWQSPVRVRYFWGLVIATPFAVAVSLPSVFVIAGIGLVLTAREFRHRDRRVHLAFAGYLITVAGALAGMAALGQYHASPNNRGYFLKYWAAGFPPSLHDPVRFLRWLVVTHTGPLFAIPHGAVPGTAWLSALVFASFVVGAVVYRKRQLGVLVLLLLPFVLTFAAAALRRYPYGMNIRVMLYLVPAIVLLSAAGTEWLAMRSGSRMLGRLLTSGLTLAALVLGLVRLGNDMAHPYRTPWDRTAREFARWFWQELSQDSELICVRTDLNIPFRAGEWAYDGADQYLCYQRIYSARHQQNLPPRWDMISAARPLRCVLLNRLPADVPGFVDWIKAHGGQYTLRGVRGYPASRGSAVEPAQTYVVCEFVPAENQTATVTLMPTKLTRR
jgi:hypothetical protein